MQDKLPNFYEELDTDTREFLQDIADGIRKQTGNVVQSTIAIGASLKVVHDKYSHHGNGIFQAWIKTEFEWKKSQAYRFMSVADWLLEKDRPIMGQTFDQTALYELAEPKVKEEAREEALELADNGEYVTTKRAKEIIANWADPPKPTLVLPTGIYDIIYVDPPWQYDNTGVNGAAEHHYTTMPLDDIKAVSIPAAEDATLFMWVTNPFLQDAFEVVEAWGFEYKTNIVWVKTGSKLGAGFYVRGCHELLFICTRGAHTPNQKGKEPIGSVVEAGLEKHSKKPDVFYEVIEKMYPDSMYLELFARKRREGWESWGSEL